MTQKVEVINGFVYVDGVKVAKVVGRGVLQFIDRNKRRSASRGTRCVEVTIDKLREICNNHR